MKKFIYVDKKSYCKYCKEDTLKFMLDDAVQCIKCSNTFSTEMKETKEETLIVNFFGGPGCGKSTMMSAVFTELKYLGINCEMAPEYAKEKVWAEHLKTLEDQLYIFAKKQNRLWRLKGQVDVIITDSPILFSIIYGNRMKQSFEILVEEQHNLYNNMNFYLIKPKTFGEYQTKGRIQDEEGAKEIDRQTIKLLDKIGDYYEKIPANKSSVPEIIEKIVNHLNNKI